MNTQRLKNVAKWIGMLAVLCLPVAVSAQIVYPTCIESGDCYTCDLVGLFVSVSNFILLTISGVVIIAIAFGGFMWIYAAGSTEKVQKGTQIMFGAVTGLVFVLCGWVMVNLAMAALLGQSPSNVQLFGSDWSEVCRQGNAPTGAIVVTDCTGHEGAACTGGSCTASACVCNASSTCVDSCTVLSSQLAGTSKTASCLSSAEACSEKPSGVAGPNPVDSCSGSQYCCVYSTSTSACSAHSNISADIVAECVASAEVCATKSTNATGTSDATTACGSDQYCCAYVSAQ